MWLHQVGQHQQGLSVRGQPASARAPFPAPGREQAGQVAQGRIGEIDPRWVDKHVKLRADRLILIDNPSTRSITSSSTPLPHQLACCSTRLEKPQYLPLVRALDW